ncbi:MAG: WD40 repeat domain-containing protein [Clostridia bacterium]|nr:WD40 repeat domain-containing protein [Clostridia bacterium]
MNSEKLEKNRIPPENPTDGGIYYERTADKYRRLKWLSVAVSLLTAVLVLLFSGNAFRAVQLRYLVKYWDINPTTLDARYADIVYAVGGGSRFAFYRDDLAVFGEEKFALYDLAGELVYRDTAPSGKLSADNAGSRLAVFSPGGRRVDLYHSFAKEGTLSFAMPISDVSVSDAGVVAACLKSESGALIELYDAGLSLTQTINVAGGVVMDTAISPDGDTLCTLSLSSAGGSYFTTVTLWNTKSGEKRAEELFSGKKPISVGFFAHGEIFAVTDRSVILFRDDGARISELLLSDEPSAFCAQKDRLLVEERSGRILLLNAKGDVLFTKAPMGVLDIALSGELTYLLTERAILVLDKDGVTVMQADVAGGALDFFVLDDGSVLICYPTQTTRVKPIS